MVTAGGAQRPRVELLQGRVRLVMVSRLSKNDEPRHWSLSTSHSAGSISLSGQLDLMSPRKQLGYKVNSASKGRLVKSCLHVGQLIMRSTSLYLSTHYAVVRALVVVNMNGNKEKVELIVESGKGSMDSTVVSHNLDVEARRPEN